MKNDVIDRVRLLAPPVRPASDTARARQRRKLTDAIASESGSPSGARTHAAPQSQRLTPDRGLRRRLYLSGAAALLLAAAAVAIPLSLTANGPSSSRGSRRGAPVMQLASYQLRLPPRFRLSATATCHPYLLFKAPTAKWDGKLPGVPSYATRIESAASATGGCVFMAALPPYAPTTATRDPEKAELLDAQQVQIGHYDAWIGAIDASVATRAPADGAVVLKPEGPRQALGRETMLFVELPLPGGQAQDLVVGSSGLSRSELVSLVSNGLSVAGTAGAAAP